MYARGQVDEVEITYKFEQLFVHITLLETEVPVKPIGKTMKSIKKSSIKPVKISHSKRHRDAVIFTSHIPREDKLSHGLNGCSAIAYDVPHRLISVVNTLLLLCGIKFLSAT